MGVKLSDEELYGPAASASTKGVRLSDDELYGSSAPAPQGEVLSDEELYGAPAGPTWGDRLSSLAQTARDAAGYLASENVDKPGAPSLARDIGLAGVFDRMTGVSPPAAPAFVGPPTEPQPDRTWGGTLGDVTNTALKGFTGALEAGAGIGDLLTFGAASKLRRAAGMQPDFAEMRGASNYALQSEAQRVADERVQAATGAADTLHQMVMNPSTIADTAAQSLPTMFMGGFLGKGAAMVAPRLTPLAGAIGEGVTSAGSTAEQARQATPGGELSPGQMGIAALSGGLTGLLNVASGRVAHRMGIEDVDQFVTGLGRVAPEERKGIVKRVLQGAVTEGLMEELPQSAQEQIAQNLATDQPWDKGLDQAVVQGLLTGGAMGGAVQLRPNAKTQGQRLAEALAGDIKGQTLQRPTGSQVQQLHAELQGVRDDNTLAGYVGPTAPDVTLPGGASSRALAPGVGPAEPAVQSAAAQPPGDARSAALAAALGVEPAPATGGAYAQGAQPELAAAGADAAARAAEPYGGLAAILGGDGPATPEQPLTQGAPNDQHPLSALAAALGAGQPDAHAASDTTAPGRVDVEGQAPAAAQNSDVGRPAGVEPASVSADVHEQDYERAREILSKSSEERTHAERMWYQNYRLDNPSPMGDQVNLPTRGRRPDDQFHALDDDLDLLHREEWVANKQTFAKAAGRGQAPSPQVKETPAWQKNPLLTDLRRAGGLHTSTMLSLAGGRTEANRHLKGKQPLFTEKGMPLDLAVSWLVSSGYLPRNHEGYDTDAHDMVDRALRGERILPIYSEKGQAVLQHEENRAAWQAQARQAVPAGLAAVDNEALTGETHAQIARTDEPDYFGSGVPASEEDVFGPNTRAGAPQPAERVAEGGVPAVPGGRNETPGHAPAAGVGASAQEAESGAAAAQPAAGIAAAPAPVSAQPERPDGVSEDDWIEEQEAAHREALFQNPPATVRAADEAKKTGFISQDEADQRIQSWQDTARKQRVSGKTVLSLFDHTGEWSKPWAEAGYDVIALDIQNGQDIHDLSVEYLIENGIESADVILAACPCTDFAASGARWWAGKDADGVTKGSIDLVHQTLRAIEYFAPKVWAIENPVGRIQSQTGIPDPRLIFQPHHYGDPYTKKTLLYGNFNSDLPQANVAPVEGSKMHRMGSGKQAERSITPEGFAYAFFMANGGEGFTALQPETQAPAQAPAPAPAAAPAPEAEPALKSYSADELRARASAADAAAQEKAKADAAAEKKAKAEADAKEIAARQASSADNFQLGQSADDALSGQQPLLEALDSALADESKVPPGATGKDFMAQAMTQRPSQWLDGWHALGLKPAEAANLPIRDQVAKLSQLYKDKFGITVTEQAGAISRETVDSLLDGYRNITAMMSALGLAQNAVGLNGRLKLSLRKYTDKLGYLGAYFPDTGTIVMPGRSNSFGHEWMHALDHFLTEIAGHDASKKGLFSYVVRAEGAKTDERMQGAFAAVLNTLFTDHSELAWHVLQLQVKASGRNVHGEATPAAKHAQQQLDAVLAGKAKATGELTPSQYAQSAAQYQAGKESYWANPAEMLARAFEAYVASQRPKIPVNEFVTKSMSGYLDNADERFQQTFPKEQERTQIFHAFDEFFAALAQSNELGTGPAAVMPVGEGLFDPSRWKVYPHNDPLWQRVVQSEREAYSRLRLPGWGESKAEAAARGQKWDWKAGTKGVYKASAVAAQQYGASLRESLLATFAAQRSHMDTIWHRYDKPPALTRLKQMLYVNRGEGDTVTSTYHEAVSTRTRRKLNEINIITKAAGVGELSREENETLRLMMVSAHAMTGAEVRQEIKDKNLQVKPERLAQIQEMAAKLRHLMDKEFYYNREAGIDIGYAANGYLPRNLNYEAFGEDKDGFERQAGKAYRAQFDQDVGTEAETVDMKALLAAARSLTSAEKTGFLRSETRQAVENLLAVQRQIKALERQMATSEEPDELAAKLSQYYDSQADLVDAALPLVRQDWSELAAHDWRTRLDTTEIANYDTMGPASQYTKGRSLPPEADVFMQDFYKADPLDAIAEYLERSTRRVEYATRFGVHSEKLKAMFDEMRDAGVSIEDRNTLQGIVNNATGRENHSAIPSQTTRLMNTVNHVMTMYLLGRATFASLSEGVTAYWRTGNMVDVVRPFGLMVQDVFNTGSALERRAMANLLGIVTAPHADMMMSNRLSGETASREQSKRMGQFFEHTLLAPLTRAQQRAMMTVGHEYLRALTAKSEHAPSRAELRELGISDENQPAFAQWLTELEGNLPTPENLIDRNTDELHPMGVIYGTALKRFNDQVIMEPSKLDKPKLATNPLARFAFGIMSFMYAFWHQVQKPWLKAMYRDGRTLLRSATGRPDPHNAGRSAIDAASRMATGVASLGFMYLGQFLSTTLRAALLDRDKWKEEQAKGTLISWLGKLAFWRTGAAGPLDPLVQAGVGVKYSRDLTGLIAGPQFGAVLQNVQDIMGAFVGNTPNTNTSERKAAKAFYNLVIGPTLTYAAAMAPGGAITGPLVGAGTMTTGSGWAQEGFANLVAGPKFNPATEKRVKQPDGTKVVEPKTAEDMRNAAELKRARDRRARVEAMRKLVAAEQR